MSLTGFRPNWTFWGPSDTDPQNEVKQIEQWNSNKKVRYRSSGAEMTSSSDKKDTEEKGEIAGRGKVRTENGTGKAPKESSEPGDFPDLA